MTVCDYYEYPEQYGIGDSFLTRYYVCPRCKTTIEIEYVRYCAYCGQALGWYGYRINEKKLPSPPDRK
ncbi:MAG: hypothetical protein ACI3XR_03575 [Eubacteriales bacterium]